MWIYLSNETGEHKDANEEVGHLKDDLKESYGLWKAADVDKTTNCEVITAQVPEKQNRTVN